MFCSLPDNTFVYATALLFGVATSQNLLSKVSDCGVPLVLRIQFPLLFGYLILMCDLSTEGVPHDRQHA